MFFYFCLCLILDIFNHHHIHAVVLLFFGSNIFCSWSSFAAFAPVTQACDVLWVVNIRWKNFRIRKTNEFCTDPTQEAPISFTVGNSNGEPTNADDFSEKIISVIIEMYAFFYFGTLFLLNFFMLFLVFVMWIKLIRTLYFKCHVF